MKLFRNIEISGRIDSRASDCAKHLCYLPESALKRISRGLDKSYSEVAGVVGFTRSSPRFQEASILFAHAWERHATSGREAGARFDKAEFGYRCGETTQTRCFLEVARCFGACGLAPTITIDNEVYQRLKPLKVHEILDKYRDQATAAEKGA